VEESKRVERISSRSFLVIAVGTLALKAKRKSLRGPGNPAATRNMSEGPSGT
jgi:hypothetical protein